MQVAIPLGIGSTQNIECIIVNIHVNEYIRRQESHIVGRVPCDQSLEAIKCNSSKKDTECVKAQKRSIHNICSNFC